MYKELIGVCRICTGCTRLEQEGFLGVKECNYMISNKNGYRANMEQIRIEEGLNERDKI